MLTTTLTWDQQSYTTNLTQPYVMLASIVTLYRCNHVQGDNSPFPASLPPPSPVNNTLITLQTNSKITSSNYPHHTNMTIIPVLVSWLQWGWIFIKLPRASKVLTPVTITKQLGSWECVRRKKKHRMLYTVPEMKALLARAVHSLLLRLSGFLIVVCKIVYGVSFPLWNTTQADKTKKTTVPMNMKEDFLFSLYTRINVYSIVSTVAIPHYRWGVITECIKTTESFKYTKKRIEIDSIIFTIHHPVRALLSPSSQRTIFSSYQRDGWTHPSLPLPLPLPLFDSCHWLIDG